MSNPTPSDVHVNTPLTNISIAYMQDATKFVADRVFPNIPVSKQSDRYYTYDRGMFNRDEMQVRAPATESAGASYTVDNTPTYFAPVKAIHHDIPDEVLANADSVLNPDLEATQFVTQKALISREKSWATQYFASGNWTTDIDGVAATPTGTEVLQWNDASSTPIENIRVGITTVEESTGLTPNTLVIGKAVYDSLVDHPDIVDRIKYGQTAPGVAMVNLSAMAALFDVDNIYVMRAIENTAKEGVTNVHSFIGGKKALLCHSAPSPGLMTPSAGYTFSWTGFTGASPAGHRIKKFRIEEINASRVELDMAFDQKLISADLGYFFDTIVA